MNRLCRTLETLPSHSDYVVLLKALQRYRIPLWDSSNLFFGYELSIQKLHNYFSRRNLPFVGTRKSLPLPPAKFHMVRVNKPLQRWELQIYTDTYTRKLYSVPVGSTRSAGSIIWDLPLANLRHTHSCTQKQRINDRRKRKKKRIFVTQLLSIPFHLVQYHSLFSSIVWTIETIIYSCSHTYLNGTKYHHWNDNTGHRAVSNTGTIHTLQCLRAILQQRSWTQLERPGHVYSI